MRLKTRIINEMVLRTSPSKKAIDIFNELNKRELKPCFRGLTRKELLIIIDDKLGGKKRGWVEQREYEKALRLEERLK